MVENLAEREQAARELLDAERAFQWLLEAMQRGATAQPYAAVRARLERAQQRVEALLGAEP